MTKKYIANPVFCFALCVAAFVCCFAVCSVWAEGATSPYGWWYTEAPAASGHPGGMQTQARESQGKDHGAGVTEKEPEAAAGSPNGHSATMADAKPDQPEKPEQKAASGAMGARVSHSFTLDSRTTKSFYLAVSEGADVPEEEPEVYYRFTTRTMERHGGIPISSTVYRAKVERDKNTWRADIYSPEFGTAEIFSRFVMNGAYVYSQHNYLHYVRRDKNKGSDDGDKADPMPPLAQLPEDWPRIAFPVGSYNDMPFRGLRIGDDASFGIDGPAVQGGQGQRPAALVFEDNIKEPLALPYDYGKMAFKYAPRKDEVLENAPRRVTKSAVIVVVQPDGQETATFSLSVSRSKWSGLDLNMGMFLLFGTAIAAIAIVLYRRRRFKFYDRN